MLGGVEVRAIADVRPHRPLAMGKTFATADGVATATIYSYRHVVARTAPRPDEQPGYVWAAIDVKVCAHKPAGEQEHQGNRRVQLPVEAGVRRRQPDRGVLRRLQPVP
ncbi:hypothetical protein GCM10027452_05030 [Micromonospora halotolerans]